MNRLPLRGGNWNNGSNAGLASLNLNNPRSNANSNIGFRPALGNTVSGIVTNFEKDVCTSALAETLNLSPDASGSLTLYDQIIDIKNLYTAAYQCQRGKRSNPEVIKFMLNLDLSISYIRAELKNDTFKPQGYKHFYVFEPKRRLISAPTFKDRVLHRSIYNVLYPIYDKLFIYDSYACRIAKGTHAGADRAQKFIRLLAKDNKMVFALKADIKHYFSSIDHQILKRLISRRISCKRTLELLNIIIDSSPTKLDGVGIPLGNLTSQLFANIYLHELDFFVKHHLKEPYYIRYMDDFVILSNDKKHLNYLKAKITSFLNSELRLETNNKTQIFPINTTKGRSLDFLGYRIYKTHRLLRKSSVKRMKTKLKRFQKLYAANEIQLKDINPCIQSWLGHAKHANTYNLRCKLMSTTFIRS